MRARQEAAASTLTADGKQCTALASRRAVNPDAANRKAGTLSFCLPTGFSSGSTRLVFAYGATGYSCANLTIQAVEVVCPSQPCSGTPD